jgi:putative PEP-CTERM system histidine kinase
MTTLASIATFGYGLAALCFLVFAGLLVTAWRARPYGRLLGLAAFASTLWALLAAAAAHGSFSTGWLFWAEVGRYGAWAAALVELLRQGSQGARSTPSLAWVGWLFALAMGAVLVPPLAALAGIEVGSGSTALGFMVMAVLAMLMVEQLYRNKSGQERWAIKFLCLGMGGQFVFDFYLYSDFALFRRISPDIWGARGYVLALMVPLMALSVKRSASWVTGLAVSRAVAFHSAALFGSAAYLLAMGFAGYFMRFVGGEWGTVVQLTFLFGAAILLLTILFSGTFRSWLRVSISKHFYRYTYDYREEWMRFTRRLAETGPGLGERVIQALASLVESTGGALLLKDAHGMLVARAGWHLDAQGVSEPIDSPFAQLLATKEWVFDLAEYESNPELYGDLEIPSWLHRLPRAWLVVPLIVQSELLGFVLLLQPRSQVRLNWEVIDVLRIAGRQAAGVLAQEEATTSLMLARQFESFNRMSTFIVHDLKNLVAQLSLLSANAQKHKDNPEFQADMIETVGFSVQKMKLLLQRLGRTDHGAHTAPLAVEQVVRQAMAIKEAFEPHPELHVEASGLRVLADPERLERVLGHLIQNAIEATPRDGQVRVTLRRASNGVVVEIRDTGEGMSEDFIRERLFRPFETTKSAGMGIGAFESREYIQELGGTLVVDSQPGQGSTFTVTLPEATLSEPVRAPA